MSVRLIIGDTGTGKSGLIYEEIKKKIEQIKENNTDLRPLYLIVPEQSTYIVEKKLVTELANGSIGLEVLSIQRLSYRVIEEVARNNYTSLDQQGKIILLRSILSELREELKVYQHSKEQKGFMKLIIKMLEGLKEEGVTAQDLFKMLSLFPPSLLSYKLNDLALIYQEVERISWNSRFFDREDMVTYMLEHIEKVSFLKGAQFYFDSFHYWNKQMLELIGKLGFIAADITITIPQPANLADQTERMMPNNEIFHEIDRSLTKIKEVLETNQINYEVLNLSEERRKLRQDAAIYHLQKNLFSFPYQLFNKQPNSLKIVVQKNLQMEVEWIAQEIWQLIRDQGFRMRDIGILTSDLAKYAPIIKRTFTTYQLSYFLDEKRSLINHPLAIFLKYTLKVLENYYRYQDLFQYTKTGFSKLTAKELRELEVYAKRYSLEGGSWLKEFSLGENEYNLTNLNQIREKLVTPLEQLRKKFKGKRTVKIFTASLFTYLEQLEVPKVLTKWSEELFSLNELVELKNHEQVWDLVVTTLEKLVAFSGEKEVTLSEYRLLLESGLEEVEISIIPSRLDQIFVGSLQYSEVEETKALFFIGSIDGLFPFNKEQDLLFADEEIEKLEANGINYNRGNSESDYLIYKLIGKTLNNLYFTYPLADNEGKSLRPALILQRVKEIFPKVELISSIKLEEEVEVVIPSSTFPYLIDNLRENKVQGSDFWQKVLKFYQQDEGWKTKLHLLRTWAKKERQKIVIKKELWEALVPNPFSLSVSQIESYLTCPYKYFISYILKPTDISKYGIDSLLIGELIHTVLEQYMKYIIAREEDDYLNKLTKEESDRLVNSLLTINLNTEKNYLFSLTARNKALYQRVLRILERSSYVILEQIRRGDFRPFALEIAFGKGEKNQGIPLQISDDRTVYLEGRIDRLDVWENGENIHIRIIDYKSGKKELKLSQVFHGLQLQLPFYLYAALNLTDMFAPDKKLIGAGLFYYQVNDPMIKLKEINEREKADEINKEILKKLKLKGYLLKDQMVAVAMDRNISHVSEIIPARLKKDGEFYSDSKVLAEKDFTNLLNYTTELVKNKVQDIIDGIFPIQPVKDQSWTGCSYCSYRTVCQFEPKVNDFTYRNLNKLKDEEVLRELRKGDK